MFFRDRADALFQEFAQPRQGTFVVDVLAAVGLIYDGNAPLAIDPSTEVVAEVPFLPGAERPAVGDVEDYLYAALGLVHMLAARAAGAGGTFFCFLKDLVPVHRFLVLA